MKREDINDFLGVTEEDLDKEAEQYENDTWEGGLTKASPGRPKLYDEEMRTVSFRVPASQQRAVAAASSQLGISRSEFFRNALEHELKACLA